MTEARIKASVERLIEAGLIEAIGTGRSRSYILSSKVYKISNNSIGYVMQKDIDSIRHEELALQLVKKQGYITRKYVIDLFRINEPQAYRLLAALAQKEMCLSARAWWRQRGLETNHGKGCDRYLCFTPLVLL